MSAADIISDHTPVLHEFGRMGCHCGMQFIDGHDWAEHVAEIIAQDRVANR